MEEPHIDSVDPQSNPGAQATEAPKNPDLIPEEPPPIKHKKETTNCKPDQTPLWKMILEIGAVAVGIVVALIYYGQLQVMRGQLEEIIRQYPEIQKSATATRDGADATTRAMKFSERAQIEISRVEVANFQAGTEIEIPCPVANVGKTVARNVTINAVVQLLPRGTEPDFLYLPNHTPDNAETGMVFPSDKATFRFHSLLRNKRRQVLSKNDFGAIVNGDKYAITYGTATYCDIFYVPHWINFCFYQEKSGVNPEGHKRCAFYNETDDNEKEDQSCHGKRRQD